MSRNTTQRGFTLIEMIVSLGLFSVVVTTAVGALLMFIAANRQLQAEQSVMTNLSFALDSMTREIRTGTHYFCADSNNLSSGHPGGIDNMFNPNTDLDAELGTDEHPCPGISTLRYRGLSFREGGDSISGNGERILYYYDKEEGKIYRRIGTEQPESIVSSGIYIRDFQFIVSGTEPKSENPGSPDTEQPTVTILIDALDKKEVEISGGGEGDSAAEPKSYKVQTTVTQRIIDI